MIYVAIFLFVVAVVAGRFWLNERRKDQRQFEAIEKARNAILNDDNAPAAINHLSTQFPSIVHELMTENPTVKRVHARISSLLDRRDRTIEYVLGYVAAGTLAISLVLSIWASIVVVQPGEVGVMVVFGDAKPDPLGEGLSFINPFAKVYRLNVRTQSYTMTSAFGEGKVKGDDSVGTLSKDGLPMKADVTITYRLSANDAVPVYRYFGTKYEEELIRPAGRTAMNEAMSEFFAIDAYAKKRPELGRRIAVLMREHIDSITHNRGAKLTGFHIVRVMVRQIELPEKMKDAIQNKLAAEQEAQRMEFVLAKEAKERDRKVIEADGIKKFQDIVRQGIDEQLLRWKGIEATMTLATSPNAKIVVVGGKDGLPLILNSK